MKYLYLNGKTYLYKRRIPHSKKFYTFNTKTKNKKKAYKVSLLFNKLSYNLFEYIKLQGKDMALDFQKAFEMIDEYKIKALSEENNDYEKSRHTHFGELYGLTEDDPILGSIKLDGASLNVIKLAKKSLESLSSCNMSEHKSQIVKMGKQIVKRSTPEVKNLFAKLRVDEEALLDFLIIVFKTESEILQIEEERAIERFRSGKKKINTTYTSYPTQNTSFTEIQKMKYIPLEDIVEDFLFSPSECNYKREALEDHQSQCNKMKKAVSVLIDYLYADNGKAASGDITIEAVETSFDIIQKIPKKQGSTTTSYAYYDYYLKLKDTEYDKRSISSIKTDLSNYNRFVKYLEDRGYITPEELKQTQKHYKNIKRRLLDDVKDGDIKEEQNTEPFKDEMLKCIFNPNNNPYKQLIDVFLGKIKLKSNQNIDDYWIRYFVPLIMLFTGARPSELTKIETDDCELRDFEDGKKRAILYIHKGTKTMSSKRIILIHDFLANDLGFIEFIKKAKKENREYLFNRDISASGLAGKEFNRKKVKDVCVEPYLNKEDSFFSARYVMYSLRHNYKTHMIFNKYDADLVRKVQGHKDDKVSSTYLSANSGDIIKFVNDFELYKIIDWIEFKKVTEII